MKALASIIASLLVAASLSSCMCQGYVSDVKSEDAAKAAKELKAKFYVSRLNLPSETSVCKLCFSEIPAGPNDSSRMSPELVERCRAQFAKACKERYGELFADDGETAVPLAVDLNVSLDDDTDFTGILPFVLSATVLPGHKWRVCKYKLQAAPMESPGLAQAQDSRSFGTEHYSYLTFYSPFGLIYWGGTEKFSSPIRRDTMLNERKLDEDARKERLDACVDVLVERIAKGGAAFSQAAACVSTPAGRNPFLLQGQPGAKPLPGGGIVAPPSQEQAPSGGLAL